MIPIGQARDVVVWWERKRLAPALLKRGTPTEDSSEMSSFNERCEPTKSNLRNESKGEMIIEKKC